MSAVQRTMHREYRGGSGCRPEEPWALDRLPRRLRLRVYLITVTAAEFLLAAWQLTRLRPDPDQLGLFLVVLGCGMVCVEATRRGGAPPPGTHDLLTAWWLPAALLLPPEYALLGPVLIGAHAHWRARQGPLYWRAFTAASLGLAGATASFVFHGLFSLAHPQGPWLRDPVMVLGAACCAALFVLVNAALIGLAGRAARPGESWPGVAGTGATWDFESLLVDAADCAPACWSPSPARSAGSCCSSRCRRSSCSSAACCTSSCAPRPSPTRRPACSTPSPGSGRRNGGSSGPGG